MDTKKMSVKQFRDEGFLQELNRQFLHPLGLAIEIIIDDDDNETFGKVWDYRDDPEGMRYSEGDITSEQFVEKANTVAKLAKEKAQIRQERFGWIVQPID
jgi:hypothetical protein